MKDLEKSRNLVDRVYHQILALLHNRGLAGAEILNAANLAQEFDVSRTPVNMALVRLESERLIRKSPGKGWITVPLTLENIKEIFDLKDVLEPLTAYKAAQNISAEMAAELLSIVREMERASESECLERWLVADHRYHSLLHDVAGNSRLRQFQEQLNNQLYRLEAGHVAMGGQMATACEEHRLIAEAIASRNPELAAENALKHIRLLRERMVNVVKNVLIPFLGQEL